MLNAIVRTVPTATVIAFDFEAELAKCKTTEERLALLTSYACKGGNPLKYAPIFARDEKGRKYYGTAESREIKVPYFGKGDKSVEKSLRDFLNLSLPNMAKDDPELQKRLPAELLARQFVKVFYGTAIHYYYSSTMAINPVELCWRLLEEAIKGAEVWSKATDKQAPFVKVVKKGKEEIVESNRGFYASAYAKRAIRAFQREQAIVSFHDNMKATKVAYNGAEVAAVISTEALKRVNEDGETTAFDIAGETEIHEIFTEAIIEKQAKVLRAYLNSAKSAKAKAFRGFIIDYAAGKYNGEQIATIFGLKKCRVTQAKNGLLKALR